MGMDSYGTKHLNVSQHIESATHWVLKTQKNSRLQVVAAWPVSSAVNRCFGEYEANNRNIQEPYQFHPVSLVSSSPIWGTLRYIRCGLSSYHKHGVGCIQLWMWLLHPWHRKISSCLIEAVVCGKQPQFSGYLALWACAMWCNVVQWGSTCSTYPCTHLMGHGLGIHRSIWMRINQQSWKIPQIPCTQESTDFQRHPKMIQSCL